PARQPARRVVVALCPFSGRSERQPLRLNFLSPAAARTKQVMEFIDLASQQSRIKAELDRRLAEVLRHGRYILGPEVGLLGEQLAAYVGVGRCSGVGNGTDALQIAMLAPGAGPGAEVIVPGLSYIATAETVVLLGAEPVFVDI